MTATATEAVEQPDLVDDAERHAELYVPSDVPDVEPPPAGELPPHRAAIVAEALRLLGLRERTQNDDGDGVIRGFFVDDLKWRPELWDDWQTRHPDGLSKPPWCAAFASHCIVRGGVVVFRLSASTSSLAASAQQAGRWVGRDGDLTTVQPGDVAVFKGHCGIVVRSVGAGGDYETVEGNTWHGAGHADGVYRCRRRIDEKRADGGWKLLGFCRVD